MAIGDTYRRMEPADLLVFDSAGNVSGIKSGQSGVGEGRMLTEARATAIQALVSRDGISGAEYLGAATDLSGRFRGSFPAIGAFEFQS